MTDQPFEAGRAQCDSCHADIRWAAGRKPIDDRPPPEPLCIVRAAFRQCGYVHIMRTVNAQRLQRSRS